MIFPIDLQDTHTIGLHVSGTITATDIQPWVTLLDERYQQAGKLRLYIEYENLDVLTLQAAVQNLQSALTKLTELEKVALVSDQAGTNLPLLANRLPGLTAQHFPSTQKERARQWLKS